MKRKRVFAISFNALFALGIIGYGCSSNDTTSPSSGPGGTTGSGGTTATGGSTNTGGTTATGGSTNTGGTAATGGSTGTGGSTATGGSTGSGGTTGSGGAPTGSGGTVDAGSGGTPGTGGTVVVPPPVDGGLGACPPGLRSNITVCPAGVAGCGPTACGLADLGSRTCPCAAGVYSCVPCAFSFDAANPAPPFVTTPPTAICDATIVDSLPCATRGDACLCVAGTSTGCLAGITSIRQQMCACWRQTAAGATVWDCDTQIGAQ
jgi:hypothetical protein